MTSGWARDAFFSNALSYCHTHHAKIGELMTSAILTMSREHRRRLPERHGIAVVVHRLGLRLVEYSVAECRMRQVASACRRRRSVGSRRCTRRLTVLTCGVADAALTEMGHRMRSTVRYWHDAAADALLDLNIPGYALLRNAFENSRKFCIKTTYMISSWSVSQVQRCLRTDVCPTVFRLHVEVRSARMTMASDRCGSGRRAAEVVLLVHAAGTLAAAATDL